MKSSTTKKLFAFIITVMMFSVMPALVNAQKKCTNGHCPKGYTCINGYCVKSGGGGGCNCLVRPIPPECGQICGWLTSSIPPGETTLANIYYSGSQSATISFSFDKAEKISAKIFDMTGRLVKTWAAKIFEPGEHELQWDAAGVNTGIYMVRFNAGSHSEMKKMSLLK